MSKTYQPKSLYFDYSDHLDHGAAVLLLVRNEVALTWPELRKIYRYDRDGRAFHSDDLVLRGTIEELVDAELLESEHSFKGPYRVTDKALALLHTLGISLTQAANMPYFSGVATRPVFGKPQRVEKAAHVFVLMPFAKDLQVVYQKPIKNACRRLRLSVERADDIFSADEIMDDIWNAITNSLIIVADCSRRNPNVFYELGMAHTLGKQVVLLTQNDEDIPSDIRHFRYIKYVYSPMGFRKLEAQLFRTLREVAGEVWTA